MKSLILIILIMILPINFLSCNKGPSIAPDMPNRNTNGPLFLSDPIEEHIELTDEEIEYCCNNPIEKIMVEYFEGRHIKELTPRLGEMLSLANDYSSYKDNVKLNRTSKEWKELESTESDIYLLVIDTKYKTLDIENIPIELS